MVQLVKWFQLCLEILTGDGISVTIFKGQRMTDIKQRTVFICSMLYALCSTCICSAQSENRYNSGIVLRKVGILTLWYNSGIVPVQF